MYPRCTCREFTSQPRCTLPARVCAPCKLHSHLTIPDDGDGDVPSAAEGCSLDNACGRGREGGGGTEKKGGKGSEAEPALVIQAVKACVSERLLDKTMHGDGS